MGYPITHTILKLGIDLCNIFRYYNFERELITTVKYLLCKLPTGQTFLLILHTNLFYKALFRSLYCSAQKRSFGIEQTRPRIHFIWENHHITSFWWSNDDNCLARTKQDWYPPRIHLQQQIVLLSYEEIIRSREDTTCLYKIFIFLSQIIITSSLVVKTYGSSGSEDQGHVNV
jgi:hypothetical protein